ncbi:MAG: SH3 domain-containing protein [Deltaproteobacteria bacterium]|uniref:SH3 domain-containing protein n=1 Tax=Candidatus Zymogenus saltonus TaxID=2844893 RepID=A0A9D8KH02_9DELT|nr:SH3 domain-containing protein [Candidatus Zymogenus saltonus]
MRKTKMSTKNFKIWTPIAIIAFLLLLGIFSNGTYYVGYDLVPDEAAILGAGVAVAQDNVTPCALVYGYVNDPDPNGLNVRGGPGSGYVIVDKLPSPTTGTYVVVTIVGSRGNWLEISEVSIFNGEEVLKKINGWVYAPLIATTTRDDDYDDSKSTAKLKERPDGSSRTIAEIPTEVTVSLLECKGSWVKIRYNNMEGWLSAEGQCPSPVTTCP